MTKPPEKPESPTRVSVTPPKAPVAPVGPQGAAPSSPRAPAEERQVSSRTIDLIKSAALIKDAPSPAPRGEILTGMAARPKAIQAPVSPTLPVGDRSNHPLNQITNKDRHVEEDSDYVYRDPLDVLDEDDSLSAPPPAPHYEPPPTSSLSSSVRPPEYDDDDGYVTLDSEPEEPPPAPAPEFELPLFDSSAFADEDEPELVPPSGLDFLEQLDLSPPPPLERRSEEEVAPTREPASKEPESASAPEEAAPGRPFVTATQSTRSAASFSGLKERGEFEVVTNDALTADQIQFTEEDIATAEGLGVTVNKQYTSDYKPEVVGLTSVGTPEQLSTKLRKVGYQCLDFIAVQISLVLNTPSNRTRALILEGPSGCGKSFMAKSLAKITGAELMTLSCYKGMRTENLVEYPSTLAMANAMSGKGSDDPTHLLKLGVISRAFLKSQEQPVILLIDELDKPDGSIDTFFLGPIQDGRIWLESRPPIDANIDNLIIMFTKNFNRPIDEALLRRCHPIRMTYLDSTLERRILSPHCDPQLVANLVAVADRMRNSSGSYQFERPPAPEELLTAAHYIKQLLDWGIQDFAFVGRNLWAMLAKSEHDRAVLDHMLRFHPDYMDPLFIDARHAPQDVIYARFGRVLLDKIVVDPDSLKREKAWKELEYN